MFKRKDKQNEIYTLEAKITELTKKLVKIEMDKEHDVTKITRKFGEEKLDLELKYKKILAEMEIRRSAESENMRQEYEAKLLQVKKDAQEEIITAKKEMQDESYRRLSDQLEKLHTEGNVMTKFMHDLAMEHKKAIGIGYKND